MGRRTTCLACGISRPRPGGARCAMPGVWSMRLALQGMSTASKSKSAKGERLWPAPAPVGVNDGEADDSGA